MILDDLRSTSLRTEKELILHYALSLDKVMFLYAYDTYKMYYQNFSDINWSTVKCFSIADKQILDVILAREVTGNAARTMILEHCKIHGDLIKLICNKDLDCGISIITLNKVFGKNFIQDFKVQLATSIDDINNIKYPCVAQIKYNGTRVVTLIDECGEVSFWTRNGKTFKYIELENDIKKAGLTNIMLDGELCFGDSQGHNHTKISGIVNSAIKGNPITGINCIQYNVFDTMRYTEFKESFCLVQYKNRLNEVKHFVELFNSPIIKTATTFTCSDAKELNSLFEQMLENSYEGLIVKPYNHLYTFKRSKDWIKLKAELTIDLECIDIEPGKGKYEGMIGSLICKGPYVKNNLEVIPINVKVGSGLTDVDRNKPFEDYIGKIIEIKYNDIIIDNTTNEYSLFLPRFMIVREDKSL